jgi:HD domain-containing protein
MLEVMKEELGLIQNQQFKDHVKRIISKAPKYILEIPSSSTGKYHPQDEIQPNGMIKHIKRCVVVVVELAKMYAFTSDKIDVLIAGCLVHDIFKSGNPQGKYTVPEHPLLAYSHIQEYMKNNKMDNNAVVGVLLDRLSVVCLHHEGQWTIAKSHDCRENSYPELSHVMHSADYIVSRRSIYDVMQKDFI